MNLAGKTFGPLLWVSLARFSLGAISGVLGGMAAFRMTIFRPETPMFQCITVGCLLAAVLTLVRLRQDAEALLLVIAFGLLSFGLGAKHDWTAALAAPLLGLGTLLSAIIFDLLARGGVRFGKFLVLGPLMGGVFLAVGPLAEFHRLTEANAVRTMLLQLLLGLVIGDSVGLGVELAELATGRWKAVHGRTNLDLPPPVSGGTS